MRPSSAAVRGLPWRARGLILVGGRRGGAHSLKCPPLIAGPLGDQETRHVWMANPEHLEIISRGVQHWNAWRRLNPDVQHPDLSGASLNALDLRNVNFAGTNLFRGDCAQSDFRGANLEEADFRKARLDFADFRGATFRLTDLTAAGLTGAHFEGTDLRGVASFAESDLEAAHFDDADLTGVDFLYARLRRATLVRATLCRANLLGAFLEEAKLEGANLQEADLSLATIVKTSLVGANLSDATVFGVSAWRVKLDGAIQTNLRISDEGQPSVTVDDLQVAQFIYLLLNYQNLRSVLDSVTRRGVLILGRFGGGGIEVLRALGEELRRGGYLPMIFEFARPRDRTYTETVRTLAGLARFVVVDLSGPSVPQELYATVPHLKIPFVPILEKGRQPYSMFSDLLEYEWVLKPIVEFQSTADLLGVLLDKIVKPAEKRVETRQAKLRELFG